MAEEKEKKEDSLHKEHRARVKQRVRDHGLAGMAEHEVLEFLLFFSIPRRDTNPLAHRLIEHFGGFCKVMEATEEELLQVEGVGPNSAQLITALREVCGYYSLQRSHQTGVPLKKPDACIEYVTPLFFGKRNEILYLIAMDDGCIPLRDVKVAEGLPNHVSYDSRKMVRDMVATGCTRCFIAHNHPNGLAWVSEADFMATCSMVQALGAVGIEVVDHIIVGTDGAYSLAGHQRMPIYDTVSGRVMY